ncbi:MAG: zinc-binding dehydrogenase [Nitrospinae bacterium]|nr:zinc-binding dehydrogenase [Nitrospinota bacterium]
MKAMVLAEAGAPFVLEERPIPIAGPGEAVARVLACGSGLTIEHTRAGRMGGNFPLVIGHEITAEITQVGAGVEGLSEGDAVTAYYYLSCGRCRWCRVNRETLCDNLAGQVGRQIDGGYAEYIKLPARSFIPLPEGLDYKGHPAEVSVICDAIATPYKVLRHAGVRPMENVAVVGAGGGVGIHMVMMARWAGARVIAVDIAADKLGKCRDMGAHDTVDASQENLGDAFKRLTGGAGADVVVDFVCTAEGVEGGLRGLGKGGRFLAMGANRIERFPFSPRELLREEQQIMGSRYATRQEVVDSLELAARGDVWPLVSETYPLEDANLVHERLREGEVTGRAALVMPQE